MNLKTVLHVFRQSLPAYAICLAIVIAIYCAPVRVVVEVFGKHDHSLVLTHAIDPAKSRTMEEIVNPWEDELFYEFDLNVRGSEESFTEESPFVIHGSMFGSGNKGQIELTPKTGWRLRKGVSEALALDSGVTISYAGYIEPGRNILVFESAEQAWEVVLRTQFGERVLRSDYDIRNHVEQLPDQESALVLPPARKSYYQAWVSRFSLHSLSASFSDGSPVDLHVISVGTFISPAHFHARPGVSNSRPGRTYRLSETLQEVPTVPLPIDRGWALLTASVFAVFVLVPLVPRFQLVLPFVVKFTRKQVARSTQDHAAAALFVIVALFSIYSAVTDPVIRADEGFYVSTPLRYALGDVPYRDEVMNGLRNFDVVLWPLFELKSDIPLLGVRLIGAGIAGLCTLAIYLVLRRYSPPLLVAAACSAAYFGGKAKHFSPGYNTIGMFGIIVATCCWAYATTCSNRRLRWSASMLAGAAFFVGALAYVPLLGTLAVPMTVLLVGLVWRKQLPGLAESTGIFLATFTLIALLFVGTIVHFDLHDDWYEGIQAFSSKPEDPERDRSVGKLDEKLLSLAVDFGQFIPHAMLVLIGAIGIGRLAPRVDETPFAWQVIGASLLAAAGVYAIAEVVPQTYSATHHTHFLNMVLLAATLGLVPILLLFGVRFASDSALRSDGFLTVFVLLFLMASAYFTIQPVVSNNGLFNTHWAMPLLFPVVVVGCFRLLPRPESQDVRSLSHRQTAPIALIVLCLVFTFFQCKDQLKDTSDYQWYEHRLLRGIFNAPKHFDHLDELLASLDANVDPGDFLLVDDKEVIIYYLTQTRPANNHTWAWGRVETEIQESGLEYMVNNGRIPEFAVRTDPPAEWAFMPEDESWPIRDYVSENFELFATFGDYQVWKNMNLRSEPTTSAEKPDSEPVQPPQ